MDWEIERGRGREERTTCRASLKSRGDEERDRVWQREAMREGRKTERKRKGVILDAIVAMERRNGCVEGCMMMVLETNGFGRSSFRRCCDWVRDFGGRIGHAKRILRH